jgi:type II secretory pathway pseudopilin PulG
MSTNRSLFVRMHARLHDEHGFALIETVVALLIIFASLMLLAYSGSASFGYSALARERQAATGIANQTMESVRALARDRLTDGLSSTDLTGDPKIVDCAGIHRFESCAGEAIVHSPGLTDQCPAPADPCPLVPHRGTVSGDGYPTSYDWSVYVTNDDPAVDPYRVTVIVSWAGGQLSEASTTTRVESLFFAPEGCGTSDTHPFYGPCQNTYTGVAESSGGTITFTNAGGAAGSNFTSAQITLPFASSSAEMEQVPTVSGRADQERVFASTGGNAGGASTTSTADGLPTTTPDEYLANSLSPTSGSVAVIPGTSTTLTLLNGTGSTGSSVSATLPVSTALDPCPLTATPFTQQTDGWPCGASMSRSNTTVAALLSMTALTPNALGTATIATVGAPAVGTQSVAAMVDRQDPPSSEEGIRSSVQRSFGKVQLFQPPSGLSAGFPSNWTSGSSDYTGYVLTLQNYSDSASAAAGPTTNAPTAGVVGTPTLHYWNGTGYSSISGDAFNTAGTVTPATVTAGPVRIGSGGTRRWYCAYIIPTAVRWGGALAASTSTPRTSSTGLMGSPLTGSVRYAVATHNSDPTTCPVTPGASGGSLNVDLTVAFDLGSALARSRYRPAPTGG